MGDLPGQPPEIKERRGENVLLLSHQIGELKETVSGGLRALDRRLDEHGNRLTDLERWQTRKETTEEVVAKLAAQQTADRTQKQTYHFSRWQVVLGVIGIVAMVGAALIAGIATLLAGHI